MGTYKMLIPIVLAVILMQYLEPIIARPAESVEGMSNKPISKDYYALQSILGQNLAGTPQEKAKIVDLIIQLLSEIDLPTLCEVILNDTKASNKHVMPPAVKSAEIDNALLTEINSLKEVQFPENNETPVSFEKSGVNSLDSATVTNLALSIQDNTSAESGIEYSSNQKGNDKQEEVVSENKPVSASYKNYISELQNIEQDTNEFEKPIVMDDFDEAKFSELLAMPLETLETLADIRSVSDGNEYYGNKHGSALTTNNELLYPYLNKPIESLYKTKLDPTQGTGQDKDMQRFSDIYNQLPGDLKTSLKTLNNDVAQKNVEIKSVGLKKPRSQLYANSLVLGDWLQNKNTYFVDKGENTESKVLESPHLQNNEGVNEYVEERLPSANDNNFGNNLQDIFTGIDSDINRYENYVDDLKNWSQDKLKGKAEVNPTKDTISQHNVYLNTQDGVEQRIEQTPEVMMDNNNRSEHSHSGVLNEHQQETSNMEEFQSSSNAGIHLHDISNEPNNESRGNNTNAITVNTERNKYEVKIEEKTVNEKDEFDNEMIQAANQNNEHRKLTELKESAIMSNEQHVSFRDMTAVFRDDKNTTDGTVYIIITHKAPELLLNQHDVSVNNSTAELVEELAQTDVHNIRSDMTTISDDAQRKEDVVTSHVSTTSDIWTNNLDHGISFTSSGIIDMEKENAESDNTKDLSTPVQTVTHDDVSFVANNPVNEDVSPSIAKTRLELQATVDANQEQTYTELSKDRIQNISMRSLINLNKATSFADMTKENMAADTIPDGNVSFHFMFDPQVTNQSEFTLSQDSNNKLPDSMDSGVLADVLTLQHKLQNATQTSIEVNVTSTIMDTVPTFLPANATNSEIIIQNEVNDVYDELMIDLVNETIQEHKVTVPTTFQKLPAAENLTNEATLPQTEWFFYGQSTNMHNDLDASETNSTDTSEHENINHRATFDTYNIKLHFVDDKSTNSSKNQTLEPSDSDSTSDIMSVDDTTLNVPTNVTNINDQQAVGISSSNRDNIFTDVKTKDSEELSINISNVSVDPVSIISDITPPGLKTNLSKINSEDSVNFVESEVPVTWSDAVPLSSHILEPFTEDNNSSVKVEYIHANITESFSEVTTGIIMAPASTIPSTVTSVPMKQSEPIAIMTESTDLNIAQSSYNQSTDNIDVVTSQKKTEISSYLKLAVYMPEIHNNSEKIYRDDLAQTLVPTEEPHLITTGEDQIHFYGISTATESTRKDVVTNQTASSVVIEPLETVKQDSYFEHFIQPAFGDKGDERDNDAVLDTVVTIDASNSLSGQDLNAFNRTGILTDYEVQNQQDMGHSNEYSLNVTQISTTFVDENTRERSSHGNSTDNITSTDPERLSNRILGDNLSRSVPHDTITLDRLKSIASMISGTKANLTEVNLSFLSKLQRKPEYEYKTGSTELNENAGVSSLNNDIWMQQLHLSTLSPDTSSQNAAFIISNEDRIPGIVTYNNQSSSEEPSNKTFPSHSVGSSKLEPTSFNHELFTTSVTLELTNPTASMHPTFASVDALTSPIENAERKTSEPSTYDILNLFSKISETSTISVLDPIIKTNETSTSVILDSVDKLSETSYILDSFKKLNETSSIVNSFNKFTETSSILDYFSKPNETANTLDSFNEPNEISKDSNSFGKPNQTSRIVDPFSKHNQTSGTLDSLNKSRDTSTPNLLTPSTSTTGMSTTSVKDTSDVTSNVIIDSSNIFAAHALDNLRNYGASKFGDQSVFDNSAVGEMSTPSYFSGNTKVADSSRSIIDESNTLNLEHKKNPLIRPYTSEISGWFENEYFQSTSSPTMHPWKAFNVALANHKVKQSSTNTLKQLKGHETRLYSNSRFAAIQNDNHLEDYLWKARPWPENKVHKQSQNILNNEIVAEHSKSQKTLDMGESLNYKTKIANIIHNLKNQAKKLRNTDHVIDNARNNGQNVDDQQGFTKSTDPIILSTVHSQDMVNFDAGIESSFGGRNYASTQTVTYKPLYTRNSQEVSLPADVVDQNNDPEFKDIMKDMFVHSDNKKGQDDLQSNSQGIMHSSFHNNHTHENNGKDNIDAEMKVLSSSLPVSSQGVTVPTVYRCPGLFGHHRDPENCQAFFICSWGKPSRIVCPAGTLYNPAQAVCDWAINVKCF